MELIADMLLAAGALGAGLYCFILGRRLNRFNDLEKGVGGAVAVLSAQVDDLTRTLTAAQTSASHSAQTLTELTRRAEDCARRLELQMAALHDLPDGADATTTPASPPPEPPIAKSQVTAQTSGAAGEPMFTRQRAGGGA